MGPAGLMAFEVWNGRAAGSELGEPERNYCQIKKNELKKTGSLQIWSA